MATQTPLISGAGGPATTSDPALKTVYDTAMRHSRAIRAGRPLYRTKFEWALEAAQLGYRVFPIGRYQRNNWERFATTDRTQISKWWSDSRSETNIGAAVGLSDITVLDVTTRPNPAGKENFALLDMLYGRFPKSRIVKTPYGAQIHMLGASAFSVSPLEEGITVKSLGAFVQMPGSRVWAPSFDGEESSDLPGEYAWHTLNDLQPTPDWLKTEMRIRQERLETELSSGRQK